MRIRAMLIGATSALALPLSAHAGALSSDLPPGPTPTVAWAAKVQFPTVARARPGGGKVVWRLRTTAPFNGGPNQLLVLGSARDRRGRAWLHVLLPIRPNGASGWMLRDYALLSHTAWRIEISLRRRLVQVYRAGRVVRSFRVVVGARSTPTPVGRFAVAEIVRQPNPRGFLGPWVLHLSGHSRVFDDFGGGPGTIGLHGRDGASLADRLGSAASHGCVRMDDRNVTYLARRVPLGTPVNVTS